MARGAGFAPRDQTHIFGVGVYDFRNSFWIRIYKLRKFIYMLRLFAMTCYFSHIQHVFKKAGIEVTRENKREIDEVIHNIVGVEYKNCPATWREVKKRIAEDEEGFVSKLKEALTKNM
jgi:hypothetical protein